MRTKLDAVRDRLFAGRAALSGRTFQTGEVLALRKLLRMYAFDCVFDVGANVGQYAAMLRRDVGYRGLIISFEPHPGVYAKLRDAAAGDRDWVCLPLALTDHDGSAAFNCVSADQFSSLLPPDRDGMATFGDRGQVADVLQVEAARLDTVVPGLRSKYGFSRPFLKMDTQGNDMRVAAGARQVIGTFIGLQSELAFRQLYEGAPLYHEAISYFAGLGFSPAAIFPNNPGHFPRLLELDCLMVRDDLAGG